MPVGWAIAGAAVAGVAGAAMQSSAAKSAANTQANAAAQSSDVQRQMFDVSRQQQQPFMESGYGANSTLSRLLGITPQSQSGGSAGFAQNWSNDNGVLMGDTYLPPGTTAVSPYNKAGSDILFNGQRVGRVVPGGANGYFVNDTGWQIPKPEQLGAGSSDNQYTMGPGGSITKALTNGPTGNSGAPADNTGLPTGYLTQTFGPEQFKAGIDPGYQFRLQQGAQGVMNSAAANSGSLSGPALKALMDYNQGSASQEYQSAFDRFQTQQGNIYQRLMGISSQGQNAAAGVGNQAVTTGGNIGANIVGAGNAGAAGTIGAANAWSSGLNNAGSLATLYAMGAFKGG